MGAGDLEVTEERGSGVGARMSIEQANPVILGAIFAFFAIVCLCLIVGMLNHYWKDKKEEDFDQAIDRILSEPEPKED